jgi:hypothetical protein
VCQAGLAPPCSPDLAPHASPGAPSTRSLKSGSPRGRDAVTEPGLLSRLGASLSRLVKKGPHHWQPTGIDLAEEPVRSEILQRAWPTRMWLRPPIVVLDEDFITQTEAATLLKSRRAPMPAVGSLIARGILQQCFRATDGADGVTRESVREELEWRRTASFWRRLTRRVGGILHWF